MAILGTAQGLWAVRSAMREVIRRYRIDGIWHFTDFANMESIQRSGGILSLAQLTQRRIVIPAPGGNDWSHEADRHKGVDEYVHLAFRQEHPMLYFARRDERITEPVWIKFDPGILLQDNVRFTADVSNKTGVPLLDAKQAAEQIDFEVLFSFMDWKDPAIRERRKAALKSEILVPDFIPADKILGAWHG